MRVVIAYDGSEGAEQAVTLAGAIQWPVDSNLHVVSVVKPALTLIGPPAISGAYAPSPDIDAQITAYQEERLADAVRRLGASGRSVDGAALRGRPASVVLDEAEQFRADLIVVGSRGHGPIASLVLGSTSAEVVDHSPCPVLVARTPAIGRVVLATDGSPPAGAAMDLVASWAIFEDVPIQVVSVADVAKPWHTGVAPTMYAQVAAAYEKDLEEARVEHARIARETVAQLTAAGRKAEGTVRTGDAAAEIIAAASAGKADLVVIGSRGQTGLTRMVLGSVARNVLHGTDSSILVVHYAKAGSVDAR
jgi:nucleotide-binding universal stress UspA family protein